MFHALLLIYFKSIFRTFTLGRVEPLMRPRALTKGTSAFHRPLILGGTSSSWWSWRSFGVGVSTGLIFNFVLLLLWLLSL